MSKALCLPALLQQALLDTRKTWINVPFWKKKFIEKFECLARIGVHAHTKHARAHSLFTVWVQSVRHMAKRSLFGRPCYWFNRVYCIATTTTAATIPMCISQVFKGFVFNNRLYSKLFQITSGRQLFTSVTSLQGSMAKERQTNDDPKTKCKAIVITGPSGSGKSTLLNMLMNDYKDSFKFCVSRKYNVVRFMAWHWLIWLFTSRYNTQAKTKRGAFQSLSLHWSSNIWGDDQKWWVCGICRLLEKLLWNQVRFLFVEIITKFCPLCSVKELTTVRSSGRIPVLDLDIRGVISLKGFHFDAKYILITAPTFERLVN